MTEKEKKERVLAARTVIWMDDRLLGDTTWPVFSFQFPWLSSFTCRVSKWAGRVRICVIFAFRVRARLMISKKILGSCLHVSRIRKRGNADGLYILPFISNSYHPQFLYSPNLIFAGRVSELCSLGLVHIF